MVKALKFKNWCEDNISPQAWSRIVLKSLPEVRDRGITLNQLDQPNDTFELDEEIVQILQRCLDEIYQMKVAEEAIS